MQNSGRFVKRPYRLWYLLDAIPHLVGEGLAPPALQHAPVSRDTVVKQQAASEFSPVRPAFACKYLNVVISVLSKIIELVMWVASIIVDNWSVIAPIIYGIVTALAIYTAALIINSAIQSINNMHKKIAAIQAVAHGAAITQEMVATTGLTAAQLQFLCLPIDMDNTCHNCNNSTVLCCNSCY